MWVLRARPRLADLRWYILYLLRSARSAKFLATFDACFENHRLALLREIGHLICTLIYKNWNKICVPTPTVFSRVDIVVSHNYIIKYLLGFVSAPSLKLLFLIPDFKIYIAYLGASSGLFLFLFDLTSLSKYSWSSSSPMFM